MLVPSDRSVVFNKLVPDLRRLLAENTSATSEPIIRLNLAVSLMAVRNWPQARTELEQVKLPDGPGVSAATVAYLLGVCADALGETGEAEKLWRQAAAAPTALLTSDGPPVKELAERLLAALRRTRTR